MMENLLKLVAIALLFEESLAQVTLVPVGDVRVCKGSNQAFTCSSSSSVVWTISGFSSGILDTDNPVNAFSYASTNDRVETDDTSIASNPSTFTFQNLGYDDDNAVVVCLNATLAGARMSTIQIGPPNCTVDFSAMASGVTISVNLTVYACVGYVPVYEVVLSTTGNERSTMSIETPAFMASTILRISDLKAFSEYNVSLELVDPYCQNSTVATKLVVTDMPPTVSSTSLRTPTPTPAPLDVAAIAGGTVGGLIAVVLVVIIILLVTAVIIKQNSVKKAGGERLTTQHGEEMVDVHGDTTYAAPDKNRAAAEGGDGVYSYAATTTVVGAQHNKQGGETKATENVSVQPEKPKRGSKKQPPPADVPHKQGPVGDLYAMPDKKAPEVGHKAGPQGDMYAMAAKPSKGGYGAEGPN